MDSIEVLEDQLETSLDMGSREPTPRPHEHGVSRELTLDPCARYKPVCTGYPEKDTMRTSSDALMADFTKQPNALQASLWNISSYKIQYT